MELMLTAAVPSITAGHIDLPAFPEERARPSVAVAYVA
jgi:hypothetical protein